MARRLPGILLGAGRALPGAFGWRTISWVAVRLAILGAALAWLAVPVTAKLAADMRFDATGALLLAPGMAALLVAITEGRRCSAGRRRAGDRVSVEITITRKRPRNGETSTSRAPDRGNRDVGLTLIYFVMSRNV